MKEPLLRYLLVATLVLAGIAPPAPCAGPGCPCAEPGPATDAGCCPEGDTCDPCVFCLDCAPREPEPPAVAPAAPDASPGRLAGLAAMPGPAAPAAIAAGHGPPGTDQAGATPPLPRHVPSIVLRV